jgi:hypothetical protein
MNNSDAVSRTWKNKKTREKRIRSMKEASKRPEVRRKRSESQKKFAREHPEKKNGGRPKGTSQSDEVRKRIGIGAKNAWNEYSEIERQDRSNKIGRGLKQLYAGPQGAMLNKEKSRRALDLWANESWAEEQIEKIGEGARKRRGKPVPREHVEKRAAGLRLAYAEGRHPGAGPNGWHYQEYGGLVMHGSYEVAFAKWCDENKIKWRYQPRRFVLVKNGTYRPDFYLPKYNLWIETKGAYMPKPMAKYYEFRELYKECPIWLLDQPILKEVGILE